MVGWILIRYWGLGGRKSGCDGDMKVKMPVIESQDACDKVPYALMPLSYPVQRLAFRLSTGIWT